MNRIEVRMFSRLIRRLTCKQLKSLLRKNGRRLQAAQSGFGNFMRAKLIRTLKAKRKMIKARIKVKCQASGTSGSSSTRWWTGLFNPNSLNSAMRMKFWRCVAKSRVKFPMPTTGGWFLSSLREVVKRKRKAYVMNCMGNSGGGFLGGMFGGFDGAYSNQAGIITPGSIGTTALGGGLGSIPRPFGRPVNTSPTTLPKPIPAIPQSPIYPSVPFTPKGWGMVQQSVPYHTHNIYETPPVEGGYATTGPIANPYSVPRPVRPGRPIILGNETRNFSGWDEY